MPRWVHALPPLALLVLLAAVFAGVALIGLRFARRWIVPRFQISSEDNKFTGAVHHGILVVYGLAVALIAVAVWEHYSTVSKLVSGEATALAMIYRDTAGYAEPLRTELRNDLRKYTEQVIQEAWPQQRRGEIPRGGVALMDDFQTRLLAFAPSNERESVIHAETLHAYNNLIEARRLRLDAVDEGLSGEMWAVVLFGALIALCSSFFFHVEDRRLHFTMVGLLALLMGLLVFQIIIYDRPFQGSLGVTPEAYQLIYDQLMKP